MVTTAAALRPTSVGVSPGTTTMLLTGPTAPEPVVGCENPDRAARQRNFYLFPPGKFVRLAGFVQQASTMIKNAVVSPYETIESLNGTRRRSLGMVLAPYGNLSPSPSSEIVSATKSRAYCTRRGERGPNYRWWQTKAYGNYDDSLGAVPTDLQLSTQYGYTPVISQWVPFNEGTWAPAPWSPPRGPTSLMPQDQGFWTAPAAGPVATTGAALQGLGADVVTPPAPPLDPAAASLLELQRHQDRMYLLGIISAGAVASTALVNVFRYMHEKHTSRRRTKVDAEPAPSISGARRRRRRRS